jgi:WD40 repeat protein
MEAPLQSDTSGRWTPTFLLLLWGALIYLASSSPAAPIAPQDSKKNEATPVSYFNDIRPIILRNCAGCHQPANKMGGLLLTTYDDFMAGGAHGKVVVPGQPGQSPLIGRLKGDIKPQMPFGAAPLAAEQIDLFRRWIAEGTKDDSSIESSKAAASAKPPVYHLPPVITALAYSPDGKILAVSGYREILLHHADGSGLIARLAGISDKTNSLAFSHDGSVLAAVGGTPANFGQVQLWDMAQRKLIRSIMLTSDTLFGVSFSPDGTKLAFGGADNAIYVIDAKTGKQLLKMNHHDSWVFGTTFSVDGTQIVSVSRDRAAKLTDVASGGFVENINQLKDELFCVARHPKKDIVLVGGEDGVPTLYLMHRPQSLVIGDTSTLIRNFERQDGSVISVAFSPDGQIVAVAGSAAEMHVYNTDTGERVASFAGDPGGTFSVVFSPVGDQFAAAGFDGKVRIYDLKAKQLAKVFVPVPLEEGATASLR